MTPLMTAPVSSLEVVETLLKAGADVNARDVRGMTPLMFASALLQYNSADNSVNSNVRFRWEYRPGSEMFLVYNEQRDTLARRFPALANKAFIVKINRLLQF